MHHIMCPWRTSWAGVRIYCGRTHLHSQAVGALCGGLPQALDCGGARQNRSSVTSVRAEGSRRRLLHGKMRGRRALHCRAARVQSRGCRCRRSFAGVRAEGLPSWRVTVDSQMELTLSHRATILPVCRRLTQLDWPGVRLGGGAGRRDFLTIQDVRCEATFSGSY